MKRREEKRREEKNSTQHNNTILISIHLVIFCWIPVATVPGCSIVNDHWEQSSDKTNDIRNIIEGQEAVTQDELLTERENGPSVPIEAYWLEASEEEITKLNVLHLVVKNTSHVPVLVRAVIVCDGFINLQKSKHLEPYQQIAEINSEIVFTIQADQFPIQPLKGASSFRAEIRASLMSQGGFSSHEYLITTAPVLYRHDATYNTISTFTSEILINKYGGLVAGDYENIINDKRIAGRIAEDKNNFRYLTEEEIRVKCPERNDSAQGTIHGYVVSDVIDDNHLKK